MTYHNLRDKSGKFTSKVKGGKKTASRKKTTKQDTIVSFYLLDDTGSMGSKRQVTVDGFNQVLSESRAADKVNKIISKETLALFGELNHFVVRDNVKPLTYTSYTPSRPWTALWQAIVKSIENLDGKVSDKDKVVLTILTDGYNNQAPEYHTQAHKLIEDRKAKGWVINFIGAGDRAAVENVATSVGIFASNTMNYDNTSKGTAQAFTKMSSSRSSYSSKVSKNEDSNIGFFAD